MFDIKKGLIYEGEWKNGLTHGIGLLNNINPNISENVKVVNNLNFLIKNWIKYDGKFRNGMLEGSGVLHF